jgi:hypothetical protein
LVVMGLDPELLPAEAELVCNLERSARAEVKLRLKHLRGSAPARLRLPHPLPRSVIRPRRRR